MKRLLFLILTIAVCSCSSDKSTTINVGLITGHTDKWHSCEIMSAHVTELFGKNPQLITTVLDVYAEDIAFDEYDVIIMNVNDVQWSDTLKAKFEKYMAEGGGMVSLHEADNAFPEWKEYNKMIGLGGWGGRATPAAGSFYYYKDGEYITDSTTPGFGGKHGEKVPYTVNVRDTEHPITKGLPVSWTQVDDELYGNLRGPAENIHPLATAYADSTSGGSGKEELVLFTVDYGKGRIFHTTLGHTYKDYYKAVQNNPYFDSTLVRGTIWASGVQ